ncbi:MAG TPA: Asp-tRNA(Asn)/Glu-tRNA(Gln) amidotransferase subunit GatA [Pirellulaceae bacterium]|jgi:aspartyl-tRNA(Asn)/glutamyl-tRNA(Gln) amidotransferase subunit A|nr:Asp-tRNA(Asn)/Glu-tRNA(Gln) amidotransferase subunit GatA [Pirellulaceae bacterium]
MSLIDSSAIDLLRLLNSGEITAVEVTQAYLDQIAKHDARIQSFLSVGTESSLEQAASVDRRRASGKPVGELAGLPVAVKDVLCTEGWATSCGSKMLAKFVPPYDATVIARLRAADAVLIGKTNMDEFAMGGSTENSAFFPTTNPWDTSRTPGGSSGGSAACVAASMAPLSIGSDTGGSIRQPAGFCGVTGLKPTYGRVSRYGLVAFASSLDQVGPLANTAEDIALVLQTIAGLDPLDSTSAPVDLPDFCATVNQPLDGLRLGIVREHFGPGLDDQVETAVRRAIREFESRGASVHEISLPHSKYAIATYYVIAPCEASSNLARYDGVHYGYRTDEIEMLAELADERKQLLADGNEKQLDNIDSPLMRMYRMSRSEGFGSEVKRRIMLGAYALSAGYKDAYYVKALKVRRLIRNDYDDAFKDVDLIVGPTAPTVAFGLGEMTDNPLAMYLQDLYTVSANLAGIAGISIPCGTTSEGMPIGLQLQAPPFEEERLLRAAQMFQQATDWHTQRPEMS